MHSYIKILYNPFLIGIIAGFITGNMSLALVTGGLTVLLWGIDRGKNYIIITTILLVIATSNINFEIVFIYFLSLAWLIKNFTKDEKHKNKVFFITALISICLFPLWKYLLGIIPAQVLNEFNIAGQILLIAGIILNLQRGINKKQGKMHFLIYTLLAGLGISGNSFVLPCWLVGCVFIYYLENKQINRELRIPFSDRLYYPALCLLSFLFVYFLIPINIFAMFIIIVLITFIYVRNNDKAVLIETVYLSLLTGLIAGRIGLLH